MKKYVVVGIGLFVIACNNTDSSNNATSSNDAAGNTAIAPPTALNYSIQKVYPISPPIPMVMFD